MILLDRLKIESKIAVMQCCFMNDWIVCTSETGKVHFVKLDFYETLD